MAGRPTRLNQRSGLQRDDGTHISIADAIYQAMETTGLSATRCAETLGLPRSTVNDWLVDGRRAAQAQQRGRPLTTHEERLAAFSTETVAAHARWIKAQQELHHSIAAGGLMLSKVVERVDQTTMVRDEHGVERPKVVERRVETSRTLPDARAIEWELERLAREDFTPRVEVTGAEGGPVRVDTGSMAGQLAAEIDAYVAGAADQAQADDRSSSNGSTP